MCTNVTHYITSIYRQHHSHVTHRSDRQSEGWRGQDHDGGESCRVAGHRRAAHAASRRRPSGQRHQRRRHHQARLDLSLYDVLVEGRARARRSSLCRASASRRAPGHPGPRRRRAAAGRPVGRGAVLRHGARADPDDYDYIVVDCLRRSACSRSTCWPPPTRSSFRSSASTTDWRESRSFLTPSASCSRISIPGSPSWRSAHHVRLAAQSLPPGRRGCKGVFRSKVFETRSRGMCAWPRRRASASRFSSMTSSRSVRRAIWRLRRSLIRRGRSPLPPVDR